MRYANMIDAIADITAYAWSMNDYERLAHDLKHLRDPNPRWRWYRFWHQLRYMRWKITNGREQDLGERASDCLTQTNPLYEAMKRHAIPTFEEGNLITDELKFDT